MKKSAKAKVLHPFGRHQTALLTLTIYAPVIYTRPCIMFWRRGYTLRGEFGGGWALEFPSFLGPVKWHRADRRVPFGAQKTRGGIFAFKNSRLNF